MNSTGSLTDKIELFYTLGQRLLLISETELNRLAQLAGGQNNWFTPKSVKNAIGAIGQMLSKEHLDQWLANYSLPSSHPKNVGIVMAGNIPLVGFHDLMAVLISGHNAKVKLSSQDSALMRFVIDELKNIAPEIETQIELVDQLKGMDAVIATGSDN